MKTNRLIVKIVALSMLSLALAGCKTYMHFKYGLTQPKEENPKSLVAFTEKHHFPSENLYMFSDSASYSQAIKNPMFRKYLCNHMIFDHDGILLQRDTTQCQWSGYDKIRALKTDTTYEKCNDLQLNTILPHIQQFGKISAPGDSWSNPDFTIVVTWARFLGSYNSRLFVLSDAVALNTTARIRIIWLNVDMQDSWQLTSQQKVAIK
jgi:hypothetical protein